MKIKKILFENKAQTILEYAAILSIVSIALITMNPMIKRALQGAIRTVADQIGTQNGAEQDFDSGFLNESQTSSRATSFKQVEQQLGNTIYTYDDSTDMESTAYSDLGVTDIDN
ncbi:MAG: hypothetical protein P9X22_09290 [Candidatus Zapsychrus exili]|nr:hypothetical protein [Candidatus Zapsychrus exili]